MQILRILNKPFLPNQLQYDFQEKQMKRFLSFCKSWQNIPETFTAYLKICDIQT